MKSIQFCFRLLLAALVLMQVASCKKIADEILKDPCADIKFCNIKTCTFSGITTSYPVNVATFSYDGFGNPVSVYNTVVGTGYPNLEFKYDVLHRLTDFIRPYSNGKFETWSKYVYDASGRIAFDTTFVFGTVTPGGPVGAYQTRLTAYTYDGSCRIIKTSAKDLSIPGGGTPFEFTYSYDANGNLVQPGIVYDNKVNIHRTNKIFMFVDRDFSMNNPYTANTYNGYSLPWTFTSPGALYPSKFFLERPIDNSTFVYACD